MTTNRTRLGRLEQRAARLSRPAAWRSSPAALDGVLAKTESVLRGEVLEPARWTNADAATVAHRKGLLEWVSRRS